MTMATALKIKEAIDIVAGIEVPQAREGHETMFLVASSNSVGGEWGRGETVREAFDRCLKAGAKRGGTFRVYCIQYEKWLDKPFVDDGGMMNWHGTRTMLARVVKGVVKLGPEL